VTIILPGAPWKYDVRDQDQMRRILTGGVDDILRRLVTLESGQTDPEPEPEPNPITNGRPLGLYTAWNGTTLKTGMSRLNSAINYTDAATIINRINAVREAGHSIFFAMTGGSHSQYTVPDATKPQGQRFELDLWKHGSEDGDAGPFKNGMDVYNTSAIKDAMAQAVEDGTVLGCNVMDEPSHLSWGTRGDITKAILDEMAAYVKTIFPTLPVGVATVHHYNPTQRYRFGGVQHMDFIFNQYDWWQPPNGAGSSPPPGQGNYNGWWDQSVAQAALDTINQVAALNLINGGIQDFRSPKVCPTAGEWLGWTSESNQTLVLRDPTGGLGSHGPNCRVHPDQLLTWGSYFLNNGAAGFIPWEWRDDFMNTGPFASLNQAAFGNLRTLADSLPKVPLLLYPG
jgi:hypothetical protein